MAITFGVGPSDAANTNTVALSGTTAGRSLVAMFRWQGTQTITSVACSGESNLTVHGVPNYHPTSNESFQFASLANNTVGGDKTITLTLSSALYTNCRLTIVEIAGGNTSSFLNAVKDDSGTGTNPTTSITTTANNCLVFGVLASDFGTTGIGSGYTSFSTGTVDIGARGKSQYDLDVGSAGAVSVPFTNATSSDWKINAVAFNSDGIGAVNPFITPPTGSLTITEQTPGTISPGNWALGVGPFSTSGNPLGSLGVVDATAGRSLIVGVRWNSIIETVTALTCSGEIDLTPCQLIANPIGAPGWSFQFYYLKSMTSGGNKLLTPSFTGAVGSAAMFAYEFAGGDVSRFLNAQAMTSGTSTNPAGSITTTGDGCLVVAMCAAGSGSLTAGAGYVQPFPLVTLAPALIEDAEYRLDAGPARAVPVPFLNATSAPWMVSAVAFNPLQAAVSPVPAAQDLVLTGYAPTLGFSSPAIAGAAGALSLTGVAPTVTNSGAVGTTPSAGTLTLTGQVVLPQQPQTATPGTGSLTIEGYADDGAHGSASLEVLTAYGLVFVSFPASGSPRLKALTATGATTTSWNATGAASLEPLTGVGYYPVSGSPSLEPLTAGGSVGNTPATGSASLKPITGLGYYGAQGGASLRAVTAAGVAVSPYNGTGSPSLEPVTAFGWDVRGEATLAVITAVGYSGTDGAASLKAVTATGTADSPFVSVGSGSLRSITAVGYSAVFGASSLKAMTATGAAAQSVYGAASLVAVTATGLSGNYTIGSASLEPITVITAAGLATLEKLIATGYSSVTLYDTYMTIVMNTRSNAVTEYQNYEFNSYATVNGVSCAAGSGGLYQVDGADDDDGDSIDWSFKTGQMDDKTEMLKRLPEVVVALRSDGPVKIRVHPNDTQSFDQTLLPTQAQTIHQQRVHPGKGMRSRYYAVELQGMSNSSAEISSLQLGFAKTTRRIG